MSNHDDDSTDVGRRQVLTGGAAGLAGLAALAATGAAASTKVASTFPWQNGKSDGRFKDKVVLITGATSGIGEATARAFAGSGAKVFFCGRRVELGLAVAASIQKAGGEATYMRADVREEPQVEAFIKGCVEKYGAIDIAHNNAGIGGPVGNYGAMPLKGDQSYSDVIDTNLNGVFYAMRHEIPVMLKQGHGIIINTASMLGSKGIGPLGPYSAAKHGVIGLTRSAALLHARDNLRVLTISPGPIDTPLLRRGGGDPKLMGRGNPSGRVGEPEEVAAMVMMMAAPEVGFLNGEDIKIDGGDSA